MKNTTSTSKTVALLIVGVGLATTAQTNASLRFNGSDSRATINGNYLDGKTHSNYSLEVWIKPFDAGREEYIFSKDNYWDFWVLGISPANGLEFLGAYPYSYWSCYVGTNCLTTNVWQHICCAVSNGEGSFYVNGQLIGTGAVYSPLDFAASIATGCPYGDGLAAIGYGDSCTTPDYAFFNGLIYGIKVWSRTLSATEVQAIATTGVAPSTNGLYNAVMLNEGVGTVIHDSLTSVTGIVLTAQWSLDNPVIPSCISQRATATATVVNGFVVRATVIAGGSCYTNTPLVLVQGGGGTGATATAVVSNGVVVNIVITDAGIGYTSTPSIYIYSPGGLQIGLLKAVKPSFTDLLLGTNYQLQVSADMSTWTNQGSPFTATSPTMTYPQYWDVDNWNKLFFRLKVSP